MIQETEFRIENLQRTLIDIDITQSNSWVGITGYLESELIRFPEIPFGTHIHFGNNSFNLPKEIRIPKVRSVNEDMALVFGISKQYDENDRKNVWIINSFGEVIADLSTDNAVENLSLIHI